MEFQWFGLLALLLLLPLVVVAYVLALRRRRPVAVRYSSLSLVRAAMPRWSRLRRHLLQKWPPHDPSRRNRQAG